MKFSFDDYIKRGSELQPRLISIELSKIQNASDFRFFDKAILEICCEVNEGDVVLINKEDQIKLAKLTKSLIVEIQVNQTVRLIGKLYSLEGKLA